VSATSGYVHMVSHNCAAVEVRGDSYTAAFPDRSSQRMKPYPRTAGIRFNDDS